MAENVRTTPGVKVALSIAGSDSGGGAGIQADLKTFTVMDVYGASVITAITAQNTTGVKAKLVLDPTIIEQQIDAVAGDLLIAATKTGMLGTAAVIEAVAKAIKRNSLAPLVVDPVMISKNGDALIDDDAVTTMTRKLLPLAAVVTPNRFEAGRLLGMPGAIEDVFGATEAAKRICKQFGCAACIVKGIRVPDDHDGKAVDVFFDGREVKEIAGDWRPTTNTHGSGCVFSAAIAAGLALGHPLPDAIATAKQVVSEAIRQSLSIGHGTGPVNHLAWMKVKK